MKQQKQKRTYKLLQLSNSLSKVYKKSSGNNDSQFINLLKNWDSVIGKEYSKILSPVKVSSSKACLIVSSNRNFSLESNYVSPMLLEKINNFYGYQAFKKIEFIFLRKEKSEKAVPDIIIKEETKDKIVKSVCNISNNDLKVSLEELGKSMANAFQNIDGYLPESMSVNLLSEQYTKGVNLLMNGSPE